MRANSNHIRMLVGSGIILWVIGAATTTLAQLEGPIPQGEVRAAEAPRAALDDPDVYVDDSFEGADALVKANALVAKERWSEAAQLLQRAVDRDDRKLVRVGRGAYTGIRRHIALRIAGWPRAGLAEYRRLFEPEFEDALRLAREGRTSEQLWAIFERYFCTAGAGRLADTLGQMAIESGNLVWAEAVYRRVIEEHPDAKQHEERYRSMLDVVAAIRGERPAEDFEARAERKLTWRGAERTVHEIVREIGSGFHASNSEARTDWAMLGGNVSRNRTQACAVDDPGLMWRFAFAEPGTSRADAGGDSDAGSFDASKELTIFPVLGGGLAYLQHQRQIAAVRGTTGSMVWRFGGNPPRSGGGVDYLDDAMPKWNAPTYDDGRLYAVLPGEDSPYGGFDTPRAFSELVCLDAGTGKTLWRMSQRAGDDPSAEIVFDSSPVVEGGAVFVVGRRRRAFGFEDCYLYRVRTSDGSIEHRTHLGSASTGSFGGRPATRAVIGLDRDLVFVSTNLGTVTAVSARTGDVEWLRLYERIRPDSPQSIGRAAQESLPWSFNPVVVAEGKVYCLPGDSANFLVLSERTGEILQSIDRGKLAGVDTFWGVHSGLVCGIGETVFCYDLAANSMRWTTELPSGGAALGRGLWADDQLLVSRRNGLSRFRVSDGTRTDAGWDADGEGGNLLATGDMLIAAGAARVAAYARKSEIWKALQERIASSPNDPAPAMELAEVALNAGEYDESLRMLGETVRRIERSAESPENNVASRVFTCVMKFATVTGQRSTIEVDTLERLYGYASQFARDEESNLAYRMLFGDLFAKYRRPDRALRLYQQILRDRSLREMSVAGAGESTSKSRADTAGSVAQRQIESLLGEFGREAYGPYESEARQWYSSGKLAGDTEALQRIVETFPNSETAPRALIAYGEILAKGGRPDAAARQYSKAYHRYPRSVDRPALLRTIADTYEQAGMADRAYQWLTKAVREYPTVSVSLDGRSMTLAQYRDRLSAARKSVEPSRPRVRLPLEGSWERAFEGGVSTLSPWFGDDPSSDWSRLVVRHAGTIQAIDPRSGADLWLTPATIGNAAELLIARTDIIVVGTPHQIVGLDAKSGERIWVYGESREQINDPGADWEAVSPFRTHTLQNQRLISVREDGRMSSISLTTGKPGWNQVRKPPPVGRLRVMGAWLVYYVMESGRAVICLLDAETGSWIDAIPTDESRPIEDFFVTLDGQIVIATLQSLSAYDAETKARLWQTNSGSGIRPASLAADIDAIYYLGEDGEARKIDLDDGGTVWQSERLVHRGEDDLRVELVGGSLVVGTTGSVSALDVVTGLTLWRGTTPEKCRLVARIATQDHILAVDTLDGLRAGRMAAYFYEHANQSGIIPKDGGAPDLGAVTEVGAVLAFDDTIVLQSGPLVRGFAHR